MAQKKAAKKAAQKVSTKKTATKKKTAKKAVAKKAPVKSAARKTEAKKVAKKQPAKKAAKKVATRKKATKSASPPVAKKASSTAAEEPAANEELVRSVVSKRTKTDRQTPAVFKLPNRKHTPVVFSMDEIRSYLETRKPPEDEKAGASKGIPQPDDLPTKKAAKEVVEEAPRKRKHVAASVADILGFQPGGGSKSNEESQVPKKWIKYYRELVELRDRLKEGMSLHAADTIRRNANESTTDDRSSYGKDPADTGSDNFDRDFALSLVSNEQEALYEIDQAIRRILDGTYGVCEVTGQPISKERLEAVPFTRYSLEGQQQSERNYRRSANRGGVAFADVGDDESINLSDGDSDD